MEDVINQAKGLEEYMRYKFHKEMYITDVDITTIHNLITLCENLVKEEKNNGK